MSWYAIFIETGKEDEVCKRIERELSQTALDGQYHLLVPKKKIVERHNGTVTEVERILFPGYILLQTECINEIYFRTLRLDHLYRYLKCNGSFEEILLEEISSIIYMVNEDGVMGVSDIVIVNEVVKVINGPLCNYIGFVVKIDRHKRRARVSFKFSGREHLIDLSINILQKAKEEDIKNEIPFWKTQNKRIR